MTLSTPYLIRDASLPRCGGELGGIHKFTNRRFCRTVEIRNEREELVFRGAVPTVPAKDIDRARRFYQDVIGCRVEAGEDDGSVRVHVGDSWIMVYPSEFAGTNQATAVGFGVEDVAASAAELRERGVHFEDYDFGEVKTVDGILTMPDGRQGAWFKDSEGNIVGMFEGDI